MIDKTAKEKRLIKLMKRVNYKLKNGGSMIETWDYT